MKTEKQVEKMLEAIDEKTIDILNCKRKEWTKLYNEAEAKYGYAGARYSYAIWLLALMEIANALGYHWKDETADCIKLWNLKPLA